MNGEICIRGEDEAQFILEPPCWKSRSANDPGCDESPHLVISRIVFAKTWPCFKMRWVTRWRERERERTKLELSILSDEAWVHSSFVENVNSSPMRYRRLPAERNNGWIVNGPSIRNERAIFRGKISLPSFSSPTFSQRIFYRWNISGKWLGREFQRDSYRIIIAIGSIFKGNL